MTTDENLLLTPVGKHFSMEWQEARAAYELYIKELQKVLDSVQGDSVPLPSVTLIPPDLPDFEKLILLEDLWKSAQREAYRLHWEAVKQVVAIKKALFVHEKPDTSVDAVEDLGRKKEAHIQKEWDAALLEYETREAEWSREKLVQEEEDRHASELSRAQQGGWDTGEQREEGKEGRLDYLTSHGGGD